MRFKTGLLALLISLFTLQAHANFEIYDKFNDVSNKPFNGFYAGAMLDAMGLINDDHKNIYKSSSHWYNQDYRSGNYSYGGGILGGYGLTFNHFYTGMELYAHYIPYDCLDYEYIQNSDTYWKPIELKSNYLYGVALKEGYLFSPNVLMYGLLGMNVTQFKVTTEYNRSGDMGVFTKKFNKTQIGFMPGLGFEFALTSHLTLQAQYAYMLYPEFDNSFNLNSYSHDTRVKPSGSLYSLGINYYFNNLFDMKATGFHVVNNIFKGFYLGAGFNVMQGMHKDTDSDFVGSNTYTHEFHGGVTGVGGTITGGYGFNPKSKFYLGVDGLLQYVPTNKINRGLMDQIGGNYNGMATSYFFGADIKAGYLVTPRFMFYGLIGPEVGRFRLIQYSTDTSENQLGRSTTVSYKWGIMPGIGGEFALTNHLSLVAQYTEIFYSQNTWRFTNISGRDHVLTFQPTIDMCVLGINYHFV